MRLNPEQQHHIATRASRPPERELVARPPDLTQRPVDHLDERPLDREVVERIRIDLTDDHALLNREQLIDGARRRPRHVEPALERHHQHR